MSTNRLIVRRGPEKPSIARRKFIATAKPNCCLTRPATMSVLSDFGCRRLKVDRSRLGTASIIVILLAISLHSTSLAAQEEDSEYDPVAEEYVQTYLAAHPLEGTALGFHEYDAKIRDYSRLALDAELSRLRR